MTISPGTRLGPYEIVAPIGAGGMGEVYKAHDTRLGRDVAIKILSPVLAHDVRFRARFEHEARTISKLSHPNICTLFDVGENYLVMELLEGESLADRTARGLLPLSEVLKYGVQIGEALGKAHREGVIHRDLKPGNIMLTKGGAKLLDFGLAKNVMATGTPEDTTAKKPLTQEGVVLGTLHYMAPEQLGGEEPDARTDVFAFGAVLYEMATGKRAFVGKTKTSLIGAIVSGEPAPMLQVQPLTPPALEHVVMKCLAKDRDDRWQSASDVAEELRWIGKIGSDSGATVAPQLRRATKLRRFALVSSLMLVAAAVAALIVWRTERSERPPVMRFVVPLPAHDRPPDEYGNVAVSPNGREIVYGAGDGPTWRLYRRAIDQDESIPIEGTEGAFQPFFSPDGKWMGFFANHKLMKMPVDGGPPTVICRATDSRGATWGDDGTIVFCPYFYSGLERVAASGGKPQTLTTIDTKQGERLHRWPHFLPGGKVILYTIGFKGGDFDDAHIVAQRLDTGERKLIVVGGTDGRYLPSGQLVYLRGTSLYAIGFDAKKLVTHGQPVEVVKDVSSNGAGAAEFAFSDNGLLAYYSRGALGGEGGRLLIVNRRGEVQPVATLPTERVVRPRFSPDGTKLVGLKGSEVWVFDLVRGISTRLTTGTRAYEPVWSSDGKRVAYASERNGPWNLYWRAADGSDDEQLMAPSNITNEPADFSPDDKQLLVDMATEATGEDIGLLTVAERRVRPLIQTLNDELFPVFSPDGRWIAYTCDESGRAEIYVRPASGEGGKWQVSTNGGSSPVWRRNEIFYQCGTKMMVVEVHTEPSFSAGAPRVLFDTPFSDFDVSRDGQRFVIAQNKATSTASDHLNVVVNWFDDVRARIGAGH